MENSLMPPEEEILDFAPVPLGRARHDGWTVERQRRFVLALAAMGTVAHAARAVGMGPVSAYALRKRPGAESFAAAWDRALDHGRTRMLDFAMERALHGVTTIRLRLGGVIDVERGPDRRTIMAVLKQPPQRKRANSK